jgi:hypothetical protein
VKVLVERVVADGAKYLPKLFVLPALYVIAGISTAASSYSYARPPGGSATHSAPANRRYPHIECVIKAVLPKPSGVGSPYASLKVYLTAKYHILTSALLTYLHAWVAGDDNGERTARPPGVLQAVPGAPSLRHEGEY